MSKDSLMENRAFRAVLLGVEDVVGKIGMAAILREAGLPQYTNNYPAGNSKRDGHRLSDIAKINHALFEIYGPRGSRAILQRVGRGQAKAGLAENAALANAGKLAIKFLPRRRQVRFVLDTAAKTVNEQLDTDVRITEDDQYFYYEAWNCAQCMGWSHDGAICYSVIGLIQGLLSWAMEGEGFQIQEISCRAKGDEVCRFRVAWNS